MPTVLWHLPLSYELHKFYRQYPRIIDGWITAQKIKFSIKDFFSKCDQIHSFLQIWSHLLKKSLMENFIFCAVNEWDVLMQERNEILQMPFFYIIPRMLQVKSPNIMKLPKLPTKLTLPQSSFNYNPNLFKPMFTSTALTNFPWQKNFSDGFVITVTFVAPKLMLPFE